MSALGMPAHVLIAFQPRHPLPYVCPERTFDRPQSSSLKKIEQKAMADFLVHFEKENTRPAGKPLKKITWQEKLLQKSEARKEKVLKARAEGLANYDPAKVNIPPGSDAFKTLFVARLSKPTTERKLWTEFEKFVDKYGAIKDPIIKTVRIVKDRKGVSRRYGFVEFCRERYMKKAYEVADGRTIDGSKILVDVERSQTVLDWTPRRLGGGKGPGRKIYPRDPLQARKRKAKKKVPW